MEFSNQSFRCRLGTSSTATMRNYKLLCLPLHIIIIMIDFKLILNDGFSKVVVVQFWFQVETACNLTSFTYSCFLLQIPPNIVAKNVVIFG